MRIILYSIQIANKYISSGSFPIYLLYEISLSTNIEKHSWELHFAQSKIMYRENIDNFASSLLIQEQ